MRFYIIPLGPALRLFRRGATKILGKDEVDDLSTDLVVSVAEFVDEVYEDTVEDSWTWKTWKKRRNPKN